MITVIFANQKMILVIIVKKEMKSKSPLVGGFFCALKNPITGEGNGIPISRENLCAFIF